MKSEAYLNADYQCIQKEAAGGRLVGIPGVWIEGKTYWIQNGYEKLIPDHSISVHIKHISKHSKVQYSEIYVRNHASVAKQMKILVLNHYTQPFKEHLAFVSPTDNIIFHSVDEELFLVNGECNGCRLEQRTIQPQWNIHTEHIWSKRGNGILKYQPMGKGASVSIFSLNVEIKPHTSTIGRTWTIHGKEKQDVMALNSYLIKNHTSISP